MTQAAQADRANQRSSQQGYQFGARRRSTDVVHDDRVELASAASSSRAASSRRGDHVGGSVPRPVSRRTSSSHDGGVRKTSMGLRHRGPDLPGALQLDLEQRRDARPRAAPRPAPAACRSGCRRTRRTRAARPPRPSGRTRVADEVVVDAVDLPGRGGGWSPRPTARRPVRACEQRAHDGALADARRPGQDGHGGRRTGHERSPLAELRDERGALVGAQAADPAGRGDASRSMICAARTLPTPGIDSSSAETFILPMTSSLLAGSSTRRGTHRSA